jgi:transposase
MESTERISEMEQKIQSLESTLASQSGLIAKQEALINFYEEQFKLSQRHRFGSSSEKSPDQLSFEYIFNEAEDQADSSLPEPTFEEITYKRKKRAGKRKEDLASLPVDRIDYELPEHDRVCSECGGALRDIGVTIRNELEIIPAKVINKEHAVHAYGCVNCEKTSGHTPIVRTDAPAPLISGSLSSPSAVAHIATQKFVGGIPLYRLEKSLSYDGVVLSRQTMANWLIYCAQNYLTAIYLLMIESLRKEKILHADETTVQVLREPGRAARTKSFEWLYCTSGCSKRPVVIF